MNPPKSSVDEIRARFDADVERFSNLETGNSAAIDSPLALELIAQAAAACTPLARHVLDVGCGAGNYTLKLLERLPALNVTLVDLSRPMLDRAVERVGAATRGTVIAIQSDLRDLVLEPAGVDIILAACVLHHLRADAEWRAAFQSFHAALRPGGSLWIFDMVESASRPLQSLMQARYGDYLTALGGQEYRDKVFAYVAAEDTPQPLLYQLDLLRSAGFAELEVLHKHTCFAAFGGVKR